MPDTTPGVRLGCHSRACPRGVRAAEYEAPSVDAEHVGSIRSPIAMPGTSTSATMPNTQKLHGRPVLRVVVVVDSGEAKLKSALVAEVAMVGAELLRQVQSTFQAPKCSNLVGAVAMRSG